MSEENQLLKQPDEQFCSSCGKPIKIKAEICPYCGVRQIKSNEKSWIACLLLCLFLGNIYAHRFYVGRVKGALTMIAIGIVSFILFFIGFALLIAEEDGGAFTVLGIIGLAIYELTIIIDFITILVGKFKDSEGSYVIK